MLKKTVGITDFQEITALSTPAWPQLGNTQPKSDIYGAVFLSRTHKDASEWFIWTAVCGLALCLHVSEKMLPSIGPISKMNKKNSVVRIRFSISHYSIFIMCLYVYGTTRKSMVTRNTDGSVKTRSRFHRDFFWDFASVSSATAFKIVCFYRKQRISITFCAANNAFLCIDIICHPILQH